MQVCHDACSHGLLLQDLAAFKTPGPGAYQPEKNATCFQGERKGPLYSLGYRSRYRKSKPPFNYCAILLSSHISLSLPSSLPCTLYTSSGDANPSPNTYTLPTLIGDRVPNKPSSACYSMSKRLKIGDFATDYARTPGPARYETTSADVTQRKQPCYSMQARQYMPAGTMSVSHSYIICNSVCRICSGSFILLVWTQQ